VFHFVDAIAKQLASKGFKKLSERDTWKLERGGKYYVKRNGSALIGFVVGENYEPGNGVAMSACHVDSIATKRESFEVC
jgi:aminopeptidase I